MLKYGMSCLVMLVMSWSKICAHSFPKPYDFIILCYHADLVPVVHMMLKLKELH